MQENIKQIIEQNYEIGAVLSIDRIGSGLIHETYKFNTNQSCFVFQKLHPKLSSPGISHDFEAVTEYLHARGVACARLIKTKNGLRVFECDGSAWRMQTCIEGMVFNKVENEQVAYEAGSALARFHNALSDFKEPFESNFILHDTHKELVALSKAFTNAPKELIKDEIMEMVQFLLMKTPEFYLPQDLPIWVIHGDPKISNIIFYQDKARVMIDLDTCMRGSVLLDLGDALRDWCAVGEKYNLRFSKELYNNALDGYKKHNQLSGCEMALVPQAVQLITLELASRFLADYFLDSYFAWDSTRYSSRRAHNLARARGQIRLFEDMQK